MEFRHISGLAEMITYVNLTTVTNIVGSGSSRMKTKSSKAEMLPVFTAGLAVWFR